MSDFEKFRHKFDIQLSWENFDPAFALALMEIVTLLIEIKKELQELNWMVRHGSE